MSVAIGDLFPAGAGSQGGNQKSSVGEGVASAIVAIFARVGLFLA